MLTNPYNLSLGKGIARSVTTYYLIYLTKNQDLFNQEPRYPPDWIMLDIWALLNCKSFDILLAKAFICLIVSLVVRNSLCGNSLF